jgi:hypothetical protein
MSDYNSSLPIRTEADGTDERLHAKLVDYVDPSGVDKQLEISEKKIHVRNFSKDSDGIDRQVLLSQEGHTQSNGKYDATTNKRPSSQGLITSDRSASPSEETMNLRPTSVLGNDDKVAVDVAISDSNGNRIDENNPLAVYVAESPADEVNDHFQGVNIAKNAVSNHDYTTQGNMKKLSFSASASGKIKVVLQIETAIGAGTFTNEAVRFNSTANPNVEGTYFPTVESGRIVRIAITNLDQQPQDVYSEIKGLEF